jgi:hypothetical protein
MPQEKENPAEAGLDFAAFGVFRTAFGLMVEASGSP